LFFIFVLFDYLKIDALVFHLSISKLLFNSDNICSCSILSAEFVHAAVPDGKTVDAMILSNVKRKASSPLNGTEDEVCALSL
jgi:hypothetical protein